MIQLLGFHGGIRADADKGFIRPFLLIPIIQSQKPLAFQL